MVLSRFFSLATVLVVGGASATACSSAPVENATQAEQDFKTCPSWGCAPVCYDDPTCRKVPTTWATVHPPVGVGRAPNYALLDEMIAAGCSTPYLYTPCTNGALLADGSTCWNMYNDLWAVTMCPMGVSGDIAALAMPGCDQCTGTPLPYHFFVTWDPSGGMNPGGCHSPDKCNTE